MEPAKHEIPFGKFINLLILVFLVLIAGLLASLNWRLSQDTSSSAPKPESIAEAMPAASSASTPAPSPVAILTPADKGGQLTADILTPPPAREATPAARGAATAAVPQGNYTKTYADSTRGIPAGEEPSMEQRITHTTERSAATAPAPEPLPDNRLRLRRRQ